MTDSKQSLVSAWIGTFGSEEALEAYLTPIYTKDGEREDAPFERDFGIRVNPDGREAEYTGGTTKKSMLDIVQTFSYAQQFLNAIEQDLVRAETANRNSLVLTYDYEGSINATASAHMSLLGTYCYHPDA